MSSLSCDLHTGVHTAGTSFDALKEWKPTKVSAAVLNIWMNLRPQTHCYICNKWRRVCVIKQLGFTPVFTCPGLMLMSPHTYSQHGAPFNGNPGPWTHREPPIRGPQISLSVPQSQSPFKNPLRFVWSLRHFSMKCEAWAHAPSFVTQLTRRGPAQLKPVRTHSLTL